MNSDRMKQLHQEELASDVQSKRTTISHRGNDTDKLDLQTVHRSVYSHTKRWIDLAGALIGLLLTAIIIVPVTIAIIYDCILILKTIGVVFLRKGAC